MDAEANIAENVDGGDEEGQREVVDGKTSNQPAEGASQIPAFGTGFTFDASAGGGFDMHQMQMMMAMQNGIAPSAFGNFSTMGR